MSFQGSGAEERYQEKGKALDSITCGDHPRESCRAEEKEGGKTDTGDTLLEMTPSFTLVS